LRRDTGAIGEDAGMADHPLRIPPLPPDQRDDRTEELLAGLRVPGAEGRDMNIFATLAHHPRLLRRWSAFGGTLLYRGELPDRHRELLILRTAWNCRAAYEWGQHVRIGLEAGLTRDEVTALAADGAAGDPAWDDGDAALIRAADELHEDAWIHDDTWAALAERWDEAQLVELCMVVGQYHLVAFTLNSLGVQREDGVEPLPERSA
jgi:alkylhydroperoxidase family enzyme